MKYNLNNLNESAFEHLVQALTKKIIGNGCTSFGNGPDGGREASFDGKAPFPSDKNCWDGYWVIQAKFKTVYVDDDSKDYSWLANQLTSELEKLNSRVNKVKQPDNYLLFTNVILTPTVNSGGRDKADHLAKDYQTKYKIKNIKIIANDDIQDYLTSYRDIAITFAPFILPGDILYELLNLLDYKKQRNNRVNEIITRFLEIEFKEDIQSKLDHAGKLTSEKVNLEKVFIDLLTATDTSAAEKSFKFIDHTISIGNEILKGHSSNRNRFVLIGGPGQGKSTLTQFLAQIYRAFFLQHMDRCKTIAEEVKLFINDSETIIRNTPKWIRLPLKITLKEYASWVKEEKQKSSLPNISVIRYIRFLIGKKTAFEDVLLEDVEKLIQNLPCLFIFDGLDEVPVSSNRSDIIGEINLFTETVLRRLEVDSIIISTTRPQGFSTEFDNRKYAHLHIMDLEKDDCKLYLSRLLENIIDNTTIREEKYNILLKALADKEVSRIMKSPLQASIMAILVKSGGEPPTNKFDLFKAYFSIIFNREKQRNISFVLSDNPKYVKDIHNELGLYLQTISEKNTNPSATISTTEFESIIKKYLTKKGLENDEINSYTQEILQASIDRLVFISHLEEEKIGFAIRSLQEFFAANGYIHGIQDSEIKSRITKIAKNAYWNNVLLFAIGYLYENKDYLIDSVESICGELNGNEFDETKVLSSICKMGSWFALDILNEGVFRDNPTTENKFCQFLKPLFNIPFLEKHKELTRLSDKIYNKSVCKIILNILNNDKENITTWRIAIGFIQIGKPLLNDIENLLPFDPKSRLNILTLFLTENLLKDWVIEKFAELICRNLIINMFQILIEPKHFIFFEKVCRFVKNDPNRFSIILEVLFIFSLNNFISGSDVVGLFTALGIDIHHRGESNYGILYHSRVPIEIQLTQRYRYRLFKIRLKDYSILDKIQPVAEKVHNTLITTFCEFLRAPTYSNYLLLHKDIYSLDESYSELIRKNLSHFNSFFYRFLKMEQIDVHDFSNYNEEVESINVIDDHKKIYYLKYLCIKTLTHGDNLADLREYTELYLKESMNGDALKEFLSLFSWIIPELDENELNTLKKDKEISGVFKKSYNYFLESDVKEGTLNYSILDFLFFDHNEIENFLAESEIANHFESNFLILRGRFPTSRVSDIAFKLCKVIKLQILLGKRPSYKLFFRFFMHYPVIPTSAIECIPFYEILITNSDEMNIYRGLVLLLDPAFQESHYNTIGTIFKYNVDILSDFEFQNSVVFALTNSIDNDFIDKTIILIERLVNFSKTTAASRFIGFVRQHIANKPSGLQILDYEVV